MSSHLSGTCAARDATIQHRMRCVADPTLPRFPRRKQTFLEAIDFKEPATYRDAKLLSDAKYGKGGRMSKEQAECVHSTRDSTLLATH